MNERRKSPDFLNGVPELVLLQLLAVRPMYGYQVVQAIRQATDEVLDFGEGSIYPILHRLEDEQALTSSRETVAGRSRVVYRITPRGRERLQESAASWNRIARAVSRLLEAEGGAHARPAVAG